MPFEPSTKSVKHNFELPWQDVTGRFKDKRYKWLIKCFKGIIEHQRIIAKQKFD